jgi:hypothetical protein
VDGPTHAAQAREGAREPAATPEPLAPSIAGALAPQHGFTPARVLALQRVIGNAAVTALLDETREGANGATAAANGTAAATSEQPAADGASPGPTIPMAAPGAAGAEEAAAPGANGAAPAAGAEQAAAPGANGAAPAAGAEQAAAAGANGAAPAAGADQAAAAGANGASPPTGAEQAAPARGANGAGPAAGAEQAAAPPSANGAAPAAAPAGGGGAAAPRDPHQDPSFQAMKKRGGQAAADKKAHPPAAGEAASAQGAAVPPSNDLSSQAAAAQVEEMGEQEPGTFDKKAFIAAVKKAVDKAAPKNLEEADEFAESGKAGEVKEEVSGHVKGGKKESEKDIKTATEAPPDTSKAKPKPVTPMTKGEPGAPPKDVGAADAMPKKRPPEETDLSTGPAEVDAKMAEADVTEEQLAKSNEPDFAAALDARKEAKADSEAAPGGYRKQEDQVLAKSKDEAETKAGAQLEGMHGAKVEALAKAMGTKTEAKTADEGKRSKVAADIEAIYNRTKGDVTKILADLDGKVDGAFDKGEKAAREQFESYVGKRMEDYKDERYSGLLGKGRWIKDKLLGMPDEVNVFYEEGRNGYLKAMDSVIGQVADVVGAELGAARKRIADGRAEVRKYVAGLPADLQKVGKDAEQNLEGQFDQLSSDVDAKQDQLVDTLAQKYVEARDALDARIDEMKAANRGLVNKALDAVVGVVQTILKLKDMLLSVLAKAADVIGDIIKDPIGFLGKLVDGVKSGLNKFLGNIGAHLQKGLMDWLFGALGSAGITMPKSLDMAGIFDLVMQVLGLTYDHIRARVAKLVGEPAVARMEQTVDVFKTLAVKGAAGLWELVKDQLANFEELVIGPIKEFVIERVIKSGITWILSLLNPAAAFIKACKAIYDIVMWIVERGAQIMEFVNSVLDSIGAIAKGNIGIVADRVEGALSKALPVAISFLASLLGLGGISDKIRSIIDTVRKPINKAIDTVVKGAIKGFKKLFGKPIAWAKGKYQKGKQWVEGKVEAGKEYVKDKAGALKDRITGGGGKDKPEKEGEEEEADAAADVKREAGEQVRRRAGRPLQTFDELQGIVRGVLADLRGKGLKALRAVPKRGEEGKYDILATASPTEKVGEAETEGAGGEDSRFSRARAEARRTLGALRERMRSKEFYELDGATRAEMEASMRDHEAEAKRLEGDTKAAETDPELADIAADDWDALLRRVQQLNQEVEDALSPPSTTDEIPRPHLSYPKNMLPTGGAVPYVSPGPGEVEQHPEGGGYIDDQRRKWVVDRTKARVGKFFEWDVQTLDGGHINVGSDGTITH